MRTAKPRGPQVWRDAIWDALEDCARASGYRSLESFDGNSGPLSARRRRAGVWPTMDTLSKCLAELDVPPDQFARKVDLLRAGRIANLQHRSLK